MAEGGGISVFIGTRGGATVLAAAAIAVAVAVTHVITGDDGLPPLGVPSCQPGATNVTTAAAVASNLASGNNVCLTASVGQVSLSGGSWSSPAVEYLGTSGAGKIADLAINGPVGLNIRVRATAISLIDADNITIEQSLLGGDDRNNRTTAQVIEALDSSAGCDDCVIQDNDIGWTDQGSDTSGNAAYGIRASGDNDRLIIRRNKIHDIAADGIQGVNGANVLIDRNEIGPVGTDPGCALGASCEHSDSIQVNGSAEGNLTISNNWIHHQGYWTNTSGTLVTTSNAGTTYLHGSLTGPILYDNNLVEDGQGRMEVSGLGTGGTACTGYTVRNNTFYDNGLWTGSFPGFEWDCTTGSGNTYANNVAVDPDGGFALNGSAGTVTQTNNLAGVLALVTLNADGDCTSVNCTSGTPIGFRKPSGVHW